MVAVQMLLMNYFLLGLHTESHFTNDVFQSEESVPCSLGCLRCSSFNGCYTCKPPFLLTLRRDGVHQKGVCKKDCPKGFYGLYKEGRCITCEIRGCKDCSSRHFCQECHTGRFLFNGRCKKKCPVGFPYDARKNTCLHDIKINLNGTTKEFPLDRRKTALQSVHYSTKNILKRKKERRKLCRKNKLKERRRRKKNKRRRRMRLKKERDGERKRSRTRHHRRKKRRKRKDRNEISLFSKNNSTNPS